MNSFYRFQATSHFVSINFNEKLIYTFLSKIILNRFTQNIDQS